MGQCECVSDSKVVPISKARMTVQKNASDVDAAVLAALKRRLEETDQRNSQREIELSEDDLKALDSQAHFKRRFGFVLGRRGRAAIFDVIDQHDLTDAEVRALNRVGCLDWDGKTLHVKTRRWIGLIGTTYLTIILVAEIVVHYLLLNALARSWREQAVLVAALPVGIGLAVAIYRLYLMPFKLFRSRKLVE